MITAVHLGCKSVTIPMDPKSSKGTFLSKTRVWTDMSVPLFIKQSGGDEEGDKCQHSTGFGILDLAVAGGKVWSKGW